MNSRMPFLHKKSNELPHSPGVYIMRNKKKEIIYIGKAKILKNRVSQYFSGKRHEIKVSKMVDNVWDFDYILTDSEFEALILEASLIKQHMPKYNILLKDDKGYHYFKITNQKYRRLEAVHQKDTSDGSSFIGPYNSSFIVTQTLEEARKSFKLPSCKKDFEREFTKRPCLNYYIGLCMAPCCRKVTLKEYNEAFDEALDFINNGASLSVKALTDKMNEAAENLEFEKAAKLRDKISAIKNVKSRQKVTSMNVQEQDVIALAAADGKICFEIFRFAAGRLFDNQHFISDFYSDKESALSDFIMQYYSSNSVPPRVTLALAPENSDALSCALSQIRGKNVKIILPQKGEQKKLCDMCEKNALEHLFEKSADRYKNKRPLTELSELLGLKAIPKRIESYDISNTSGSENVAGMVVYKNGDKSPSDYRKFKIKGFIGQDDYRSTREIAERRFSEFFNPESSDSSFKELPDLILADGGRIQMSAIKSVLKEKNLDIPVFGMVKDSKHRTRALMSEDGEVELKATRSAFIYVTAIQDEVHRYALSFHKSRRKKTTLESSLMSVNGVGEKRAALLFNHFKTITAIKNASVDEISAVKGVDRATAQNIYNFFNN